MSGLKGWAIAGAQLAVGVLLAVLAWRLGFKMPVLCALGFLLHVLSRWGEFWKAQRVSLWHYLALDPPGWLFAAGGVAACYAVLPELDGWLAGVVDLPDGVRVGRTPVWCLLSGYVGSSLLGKLPGWLPGRLSGVR